MENMVDGSAFWRDKRVFLTGHTGFKGSWLSLWLHQLGARVVGYALPPVSVPNLFEHARIAELVRDQVGDIRDYPRLLEVVREARPEVVIHMAAQALVRPSYDDPIGTYATNVMGTVHLLEAVRHVGGVRVVIIVTSDKCYENNEWDWGYRETDPMGGYDPYSSSKGCCELAVSSFRRSFFPLESFHKHGTAVASVRAGNVIGGGDWATDRLIPDLLRSIEARQPIVVRYPKAIRPWQHVLEPLSGYLLLARNLWEHGPEFAGSWNFGPYDQSCRPVGWIVDQLIKRWGGNIDCVQKEVPGRHEATFLKLDCSKAMGRMGWRPGLTIEQTLDMIVSWHKDDHAGMDMRKKSMEQIAFFSSTASL